MILNQFEGGSIGATMFGGLLKRGYPQIIHLKRLFHCKPQ